MRELYVYYRVRHAHGVSLRQAARPFAAALAERIPGSRMRLLRQEGRPRAQEGGPAAAAALPALDTWMEIHERPGLGLTDADEIQVETLASQWLGEWIVGARHCERFVLAS